MTFDRDFKITDAKRGAAFTVKVFTRAEQADFVGIQEDGMLKVRLTSSAAESPEANQELVQFLAWRLNVAPEAVEIVAGLGMREKIISVEGLSAEDVEERIANANG